MIKFILLYCIINSLEKDPEKKGKPHNDKLGIKKNKHNKGVLLKKILYFLISCSPKKDINKPLDKNSKALKKA